MTARACRDIRNMNTRPIVVVVDRLPWTLHALHLACAIARRNAAPLILLQMLPVNHPQMLGQPEGSMGFGTREIELLTLLVETADSYEIATTIRRCQYATYVGGLMAAADQLDAEMIFATLHGAGPLHNWRVRRLAKRLQRSGHQLVTLKGSETPEWTPAVVLTR